MFQTLIAIILNYEGDKYDPSGPSKYGITIPILVEFRERQVLDTDIQNLTKEEAIRVYRKFFYGAWMNDLDEGVALVVFDILVQHGQGKGTKLIQKALRDVKVDGLLGPKTRAALNKADNDFIKRVLYLRYIQYAKNPRNATKMRGLTSRLINLSIDSQNLEIKNDRPTESNYRHDTELGNDDACLCRDSDSGNSNDSDELGQ